MILPNLQWTKSLVLLRHLWYNSYLLHALKVGILLRSNFSVSKSIFNSQFNSLYFVFILAGNPSSADQLTRILLIAALSRSKTKTAIRMFPFRTFPLTQKQCIEAHQHFYMLQSKMTPVHSARTLKWRKATWLCSCCATSMLTSGICQQQLSGTLT